MSTNIEEWQYSIFTMFSNGIDYWTAKNTAGTGWGDEGYFKVIRGKGHCGIGSFWMQPICSTF